MLLLLPHAKAALIQDAIAWQSHQVLIRVRCGYLYKFFSLYTVARPRPTAQENLKSSKIRLFMPQFWQDTPFLLRMYHQCQYLLRSHDYRQSPFEASPLADQPK